MDIKASDVKKLRDKTGAGMMDCKKALVDAGGDAARAEKILKELGLAAAAKRMGRATNEGRVFTRVTADQAAILELSCETDFVARNNDFVALGNRLLENLMDRGLSVESEQIETEIKNAISTIKENMSLRRFDSMPVGAGEVAVDYIHGEGGNIGVLVKVKAEGDAAGSQAVRRFAFDVALHVAAFRPAYLAEKTVDPGYLEEQEAIFLKQAQNLDKPQNVLQGIVKGKMKKHLSEICLMDQPFVKDDKKSVAQMAAEVGKAAGGTVSVVDYRYYRVGEEIE
ncbi:MAG: elongation factor Ts [Spirochaetaceae bacterium]|nr:MAG: elongation factor Ts [Spirochaetaceae bacterium]